jgi:hypothetical protein
LDQGVIFGVHDTVGNFGRLIGPLSFPLYGIGANPGAVDGIE